MPARVFVSYAHEDEKLKDELLKHLRVLERQGVIEAWHDRLIAAGSAFGEEIRERLEASSVVLLLVSPDFLASDYCWDEEMTRALQHGRALPVILRPCAWQDAPFAHLTAAPTDGKPVTSWKNRDEAFFDVVKHIKRAVAGAPSVSAPSITNLPPRNPNFTGRKDLLSRLHSALMKDRKAAVVQALAGLGGVGKTQLAIEYAHAHDYTIRWWIRSEQTTTLAADYAALAEPLRLPERRAADQNAIVQAVKRHLERTSGWLLLFDNVETPEDVAPFLPSGGHVIVTSRNPAWRGVAAPIDVDVMERGEAIDLLLQRSGAADRDAADRLAAALGDLPLALDHAAAYVDETKISLDAYLGLFTTRRSELPASQAVAATLNLSLGKLDAPARELLTLAAFLAPENIPRELLGERLTDPLQLNAAIAALRRYSLVTATPDSISVHRLVQFAVRDRLSPEQEREWVRAAMRLLAAVTPRAPEDSRTWSRFAVLLPHVRTLVDIALERGVENDDFVVAGAHTTGYVIRRDDYPGALALLLKLERLTRNEQLLVALQFGMGGINGLAGAPESAVETLREVLALHRRRDGEVSPVVVYDLATLSGALVNLGRYDEALETAREAERGLSRCQGGDLKMLQSVVKSILGVALGYATRYEAAREALEEALALLEELYGPDNGNMVTIRRSLGMVLMELGEVERAKAELERAVAIARATSGDDSVATCRSLLGLASYASAFEDLDGIAAQVDHAVAGFTATFGPKNAEAAGQVKIFATEAYKAGRLDIAARYLALSEELQPTES
ncbi:MAG TPA: FxSxx-COOH system tetratricopeptide repeat protein [Thermoanaerobaculia bacterium]|nr:FxSxx-COOH system tetratricopeptide repeat protein [Thermoanaerobaculia bacterium]